MYDENEQWLRHRYHEPGHTLLAYLVGGVDAVGSIRQWRRTDGKLVGSSGVNWRILEKMRFGVGMACVAVGGVRAEAKGVVAQVENNAKIDYKPRLVKQVKRLWISVASRTSIRHG